MSSNRLLFDIETDGLLDECSKIHCIVICDPETDDRPLAYHDEETLARAGTISEGVDRLSSAAFLCGHNILGFDIPAIQKVTGISLGAVVEDTLIWSRLNYSDLKELDFSKWEATKDLDDENPGKFLGKFIGQHGLAAWGRRLGEDKGEYAGGWETFSQDMLDYCIQDVIVNRSLWRQLREGLPKFEHQGATTADIETDFAGICEEMERVGVRFDGDAAYRLLGLLLPRRAELEDQLQLRSRRRK